MDQRYYGFMPLHPLLLAAVFKLLGVGLAQARTETVLLGGLTLALTFALGARLFNAWVGALAVTLLVVVRWTGLTYVQLSGIPLVDLSRIARYDALVPVLGLAALHVSLSARRAAPTPAPRDPTVPGRWRLGPPGRGSGASGASPGRTGPVWLWLCAGLLAGLAGLAHIYGLFWVPALLLLAVWDGRARAGGWIGRGALAPWLAYAGYVLPDLPDWRGQTAIYASRFELLHPGWYVNNLLQEYHRYGPGLGPPGAAWLLRPGFWCLLAALPLSVLALARRARRCDASARALVVPALLFPALFGLVITLKLVNYTLIELPIFAIAVAWGLQRAWSHRRARPVLALLAAAVALEGGTALARLDQAAATTTPYPAFINAVHQAVPPGSRVLGLHSYWLGFQDVDYRSFLVPLNWADEGLPFDEALRRVDPDVVLLDGRMRAYFQSDGLGSAEGASFRDWLEAQSAQLVGRVDDPTYGLMEVYRLRR
jgi:hypothetical protein